MTQREIEQALPQFEGLVFRTATQIVETGVEMEFDDVRQLLRIKVWYAVQRFNEKHAAGMDLRRYVFMCVRNFRKDIETRRPRRHNASMDAIRDRELALGANSAPNLTGGSTLADWFDSRYLSVGEEQVFGCVRDDFELPASLTEIERRVVDLRLDGKMLLEIDQELGLSRAQRERLMRSLREKLALLDPSAQEACCAPRPPLPLAPTTRARARRPSAPRARQAAGSSAIA